MVNTCLWKVCGKGLFHTRYGKYLMAQVREKAKESNNFLYITHHFDPIYVHQSRAQDDRIISRLIAISPDHGGWVIRVKCEKSTKVLAQ